jgi:hypothetical protein
MCPPQLAGQDRNPAAGGSVARGYFLFRQAESMLSYNWAFSGNLARDRGRPVLRRSAGAK